MVLDAVPLVAVTSLFIGIFCYSVIRLQLEDIRHNWQERRCDPFVIPMAHLIPTDPEVDTAAFAADNFQFCTNKIIDASIALAALPMTKAFTVQVDTVKPINAMKHSLEEGAKFITKPLNTLMNGLWEKVMMIVYQFARIFFKLSSAFDRIFGIAVSSIFAGIGMYRAIRNALNFVIYVIILILVILLVIVIFLFFILVPYLPVILTTILVISVSLFGAAVGGMADSFCVAPGTLVAVKGGWKKVEELNPGDELRDGVVEGVLKAAGTSERLVSIDGVIIAACHIVHDGNAWIQAGKHPLAQTYSKQVEELYCLNTSTRTWSVKGVCNELKLRDWEELPLDASLNVNAEWESMVYQLLNDPSPRISFPRIAVPGRGLIGADAHVMEQKRGTIPIRQVRIGDKIQDSLGSFTKVVAVYRDQESAPRSGASHAAWIWDPIMELWTHSSHYSSEPESSGYHLITESGVFIINGKQAVRDFTEVGLDRIGQTYSFVLSQLSAPLK